MLPARITFLCLALAFFPSVAVAENPAPAIAPAPSADATDDHDRYVGDYELTPDRVLRVYRVGPELRVQPSGRPESTLEREKKAGPFSLQGTPVSLEFVDDPLGGVTGLLLIMPNGEQRFFRRRRDLAAAAPLREIAGDGGTSVNAQVFNGYKRTKNADGKFKPESYIFADGGFQDNSGKRDKSIDDLTFEELARFLAPSLALQNYHPPADSQNVETIDLLVMVYWGSTAGKNDASFQHMSDAQRDQVRRRNARVLGYKDAVRDVLGNDWVGSLRIRAHDLLDEVEEGRYWVALVALDFAAARKEKKIKLLWSVRYNMPSQGTNFTTALPQMTGFAAQFFGRDSRGLRSPLLEPPVEGTVEIGELEILSYEPAKGSGDTADRSDGPRQKP